MFGPRVPSSTKDKINITKYLLSEFIDENGSFLTNIVVPSFKLENLVNELELYNKIKQYLGTGNITLLLPINLIVIQLYP